jgi:hypothetical protein
MASEHDNETEELDVTESHLVTQLYAEGELLYRRGHSLAEIRDGIVSAGIHEHDADQMIETLSEYLLQKQGDKARRNVFYGTLWLLGSIGGGAAILKADLSVGAWLAAVAGGALGITLLLRGIMHWRQVDRIAGD